MPARIVQAVALCGNLNFMETHGIHTEAGRKEITCSDCGHAYLIGRDQHSGVCSACGNVALVANPALAARGRGALSEEIVAKRVLPRLRGPEIAPDPLEVFRATPDGVAVEAIRMQYQVEWQLWAALVKNFGDPAHHAAYLCGSIVSGNLEEAAGRYREHRSVMALLADSRWQSEVADLMLSRIESISVARMPTARGDYGFDLPTFLKLLPADSRVMKIAWIVIGAMFVGKLLHPFG
jgi:hypothetical protein